MREGKAMAVCKAAVLLAATTMLLRPIGSRAEEMPSAPAAASPDSQDQLERSLWMEMDEGERKLKASPLVIHDPQLNSYIREVLCRVVGAAKCQGVRLYLIRTPDFNASMAPNGVMQVWSGLLVRTQNEAQLAAVLGHEYTHYEEHHSLRLYREVRSKSASAAWLAFTGIGLIASIGLEASIFKYSREMEHDADIGGLVKMAAAGYDTREAARIWEHLRDEMDATAAARNTMSRKDKDRGLFGSHPPSAERVAYLTEAARLMPGQLAETGAERYRAGMAHWWPIFMDDQLRRNDFGAADYLLTSLAGDGWTPWLLYARGELYRRHAATGELEKAEGFYTQAIEKNGDIVEAWRGRGLTRLKLGNIAAGQADLKEYLHRAADAPDGAMMQQLAGGLP